jgi:phosphoribosylformylglycinamidine synthase
MKARVTVTLKSGVLDPQGKAIEGALKSLGVAGVASVRQGKVFDIEIEDGDAVKAEATLEGGRREAARQHGDRELSRRDDRLSAAAGQPSSLLHP